jgi:hypothetical protein
MIRIELRPEIEARLVAEARARGIEVKAYVESLLEQATTTRATPARRRTREEMRAFFESMAANSDKIPQLPADALTRESFYQDHD